MIRLRRLRTWWFGLRCWWNDLLQECQADSRSWHWRNCDEPGLPMGPFRRVLALTGHRTVHLPDPRCIMDTPINLHLVGAVLVGDCNGELFEQGIRCFVVGGF